MRVLPHIEHLMLTSRVPQAAGDAASLSDVVPPLWQLLRAELPGHHQATWCHHCGSYLELNPIAPEYNHTQKCLSSIVRYERQQSFKLQTIIVPCGCQQSQSPSAISPRRPACAMLAVTLCLPTFAGCLGLLPSMHHAKDSALCPPCHTSSPEHPYPATGPPYHTFSRHALLRVLYPPCLAPDQNTPTSLTQA
eukprot:1159285-Pelagomonas_calceolata.AAC.7